jgi:hypothetical protein
MTGSEPLVIHRRERASTTKLSARVHSIKHLRRVVSARKGRGVLSGGAASPVVPVPWTGRKEIRPDTSQECNRSRDGKRD